LVKSFKWCDKSDSGNGITKKETIEVFDIDPNKRVLCFGELLLRLCPDTNNEWLKQNNMSVYVAGAEANAATDLALWGIPVSYLTALPDNFLSTELLEYFKSKNVDASNILCKAKEWVFTICQKAWI